MGLPLSEEDHLIDDIEDARGIATLVINSEFDDIIPLLKLRSKTSYYHSLGLTLFRTLIAASYLDRTKFQIALATCHKTYEMVSKRRKKNTGFIFKAEPDDYTDGKFRCDEFVSKLLKFQMSVMLSWLALKFSLFKRA